MGSLISVIITTFNKCDLTWHLLDSLYRTTTRRSLELIIVDNGSTDETKSFREDVNAYVINDNPSNLASSLNLGLASASCEIVIILNNDVVFLTSDWDKVLLQVMNDPTIDAVMPLMIEGRKFNSSLKLCIDAIDCVKNQGKPVLQALNSHIEMSSIAFRRSCLASIGRFDETMPLWYHHQDYFVRLIKAKARLFRCYNFLVRHIGDSTIGFSRDSAVRERLEAEYKLFAQKHRSGLDRLGLMLPPFGPFDLVPGDHVFRIESLDAGDILSRLFHQEATPSVKQ